MVSKNHRRKKQRVVVENHEDYISKLPNTILCHILSFLKIREAVRTSVLSSKWRYIYANPTNLIFDAQNILRNEDYVSANISQFNKVLRYEIKTSRARVFVNSVNQYLSRVQNAQKIDKLKVEFTFRRDSYGSSDLDEWIRFAIRRHVDEIELCLLEENQLSAPCDGHLYVFPCDIIANNNASGFNSKSSLKRLRLAHCVIAPQKFYNSGFDSLTKLELVKVDLKSEENIQKLLSSCNSLEWLGFSECYNIESLKVEYPFCPKLKYLNVNLCHQLRAMSVESNTLEVLEYVGCKIKFVFNTPKLKSVFSRVSDSEVCYREIWPVSSLPVDLPQLENLVLECSCYIGLTMAKRLPTFPNLRHLQVIKGDVHRQQLCWIARALEACPTLTTLQIHLRTYFPIEELWETSLPSRCPHNNLKEVGLTGIIGHSSEIEIAIYLLQNAIFLEKMTIDPRPRKYLGNGKWHHSQVCESWNRFGRQKVHDYLDQQAGSSVELLIM